MSHAITTVLEVIHHPEYVPTMRKFIQVDLVQLFHQVQIRRMIPEDSQEFRSKKVIQRADRGAQQDIDGVSYRETDDESHQKL
jgi:hypothetical protein